MKDITTEEAVKILNTFKPRKRTKNYNKLSLEDVRATEKVLNELEKKDKIIDAMTEEIEKFGCLNTITSAIDCTDKNDCKDCIKQYFERIVENE